MVLWSGQEIESWSVVQAEGTLLAPAKASISTSHRSENKADAHPPCRNQMERETGLHLLVQFCTSWVLKSYNIQPKQLHFACSTSKNPNGSWIRQNNKSFYEQKTGLLVWKLCISTALRTHQLHLEHLLKQEKEEILTSLWSFLLPRNTLFISVSNPAR